VKGGMFSDIIVVVDIPHSSLGYRPPAPEAIQPALTPASLTQKVVSSLGAGQGVQLS
jgi:hypothetical protein